MVIKPQFHFQHEFVARHLTHAWSVAKAKVDYFNDFTNLVCMHIHLYTDYPRLFPASGSSELVCVTAVLVVMISPFLTPSGFMLGVCLSLGSLDLRRSLSACMKLDLCPQLKIAVLPCWSLMEPGTAASIHIGFRALEVILCIVVLCILINFYIPPTSFLSTLTVLFWFLPFLHHTHLQTTMVSLEGLSKVVDPSQLTADFEGSLDYNHEEWIEIRVAFEDFTGNARHLLARLEEMQETVTRKDFPQDLEGARRMIEEHAALKKRVIKAPVEEVDIEGQRLLQRIQSSESYANRTVPVPPGQREGQGQPNADTQGLVPRVSALLEKLHSTRQNLHQAWHVRKLQLDQCFQLRLFEQDAEKVRSTHAYLLMNIFSFIFLSFFFYILFYSIFI